MYRTDLFLLGAHISVQCTHKGTRDSLEDFFEGALSTNLMSYASTPDYLIRIDHEQFTRELIRGRSAAFGPLHGVSVTPRGEAAIEVWHHLAPPLPPTEVGILRNRFVGLHAASVMTESGTTCVLVGVRGSGKSSLSVQLSRQFGNILLSDEETIIHSRSLFVEAFPRAVHIGTSSTKKVARSYSAAGLKLPTHGGIIRTVVLLQKTAASEPSIVPVSAADALVELLKHQRAWGSRPVDSYATMVRIVGECKVFACRWSDFGQLPALAADLNGLLHAPPRPADVGVIR